MNYKEMALSCLPKKTPDNEITVAVANEILNALIDASIGDMPCPADTAIETCSDNLRDTLDVIQRALYLLPSDSLKDSPEYWVETDAPFLKERKVLQVTDKLGVKVDKVEHHISTISGSPGAVYRFNGDSRLAIILYANTISKYIYKESESNAESLGIELDETYSLFAFIDKVDGYHLPWPLSTSIINMIDKSGKPAGVHVITTELNGEEIAQSKEYPPEKADAIEILFPLRTKRWLESTDWIPEDKLVEIKDSPIIPSEPESEPKSEE